MKVMSFSLRSLANSAFSDRKLRKCRSQSAWLTRERHRNEGNLPVTWVDGLRARLAANVDVGLLAEV